ncbi:DUF4297 family anti-phage-associated protein [Paenibacillus piscarius]|uniref:DUF4297 family anti-phage-associated protein n=1 Tax=Paenibacillus piscarius TaxID=1089681 RepID=UPI001EE83656|nr:DUF4297 family anti-phage-associated protein [Paenibacillus piscarius]
MKNREAIDTIRGYFYQFDYTISKLLELKNDTDAIVVEGIEDVDIKTTSDEEAVQCKYYAKTEYNHSVIAKPIRFMLNHYKKVKDGLANKVNYTLYGHFKKGQDKLVLPINITFLKENFLNYTNDNIKYSHHIDLDLTDNDLEEFLLVLSININASDYNTQFSNIIGQLEKQFNCSSFEAEFYYYNNALKVIKDVAVNSNITEREITKGDFLNKINNQTVLFNEWFVKFKSKKIFLSDLRSKYFANLNTSPFERFFFVEVSNQNYLRSELKELLFSISKKWSKISKRESNPYCPYVYIHNIPEQELIELKREMYSEGFITIDGFDFQGAPFNPKSIIKTPNYENQIRLKIINKIEYVKLIFDENRRTKESYQFYKKLPFLNLDYPNIKDIKIQFEEINDIKEVI